MPSCPPVNPCRRNLTRHDRPPLLVMFPGTSPFYSKLLYSRLIPPEHNSSRLLIHTLHDGQGFQTDPTGTDQIASDLKAFLDDNTGSRKLCSRLFHQGGQTLQRLTVGQEIIDQQYLSTLLV